MRQRTFALWVLGGIVAMLAGVGASVALASKPPAPPGKPTTTTHGKPTTTTHGKPTTTTTHGNPNSTTTTHGKPDSPPGKPTTTNTTTTEQQSTTASPNGKAYGWYCRNESKEHVKGEKGTPFSRCVTAMAKAGHGASPKAACAGLSKQHTEGEQGTPFSRCTGAAAKLQKDKNKP